MIAAGSAEASITIGSSLSAPPTHATCGTADGTTGSCTIRQFTLASPAAGGISASQNGVVVRWRIRISSSPFTTALTVTPRIFNGNTAVSSGTSTVVPLPGGTYTFGSRVPIAAGNYFGLDLAPTALGGVGNVVMVLQSSGLGASHFWTPRLNDGQTDPPLTLNDREYLYNADIEPDADGDRFGDESQDACPADSTTQVAPCPDRVVPVLTGAKLRGARGFSIVADEAGTLRVRLFRVYPGHRAADGSCSRRNPVGRRCKAYKQIRKLTKTVTAGRLSGAFTKRKLKPGTYQLRFTLTDAAGNTSDTVRLKIRIKPVTG